MKLIVGLGNPGKEYANSRHNIGFRCIDRMAREWGIRVVERRAKVVLGRGQVGDTPVVLAKPRTYMNLSGEGVKYLTARFGSTLADLVVVYDDMDLPLGAVRIRPGGSAAGHKGVESVIAALSSQEFPRVRVGIGGAPAGVDGVEYVLGLFTPQEAPAVEKAVETVAEAVSCLVRDGIQAAMNVYNRVPGLTSG